MSKFVQRLSNEVNLLISLNPASEDKRSISYILRDLLLLFVWFRRFMIHLI